MTTGNDPQEEKFGNDEWPEDSGPTGPGSEPEEPRGRYEEPKKRPAKKAPKRPSRKTEKVDNPNRPSAEEAMKVLQAQMNPSNGPKVPKGKLSMGKGGLNSPFIMCLVSAVIALVLAVAVCVYLAPSKGQFTKLTNGHNSLSSNVSSMSTALSGKEDKSDMVNYASSSGLLAAETRVTALEGWKAGLIIPVMPNLSPYLRGDIQYSYGGNQSGNVSGTLDAILGNYWTNWHGLPGNLSLVTTQVAGCYTPNSSFLIGGNLSGNYSGNLNGNLNYLWNVSTTANNSVNNLAVLVGTLNTSVGNLSRETFNIGNCSSCNISQVLWYIYNGSRYGGW